MIHRQLHTGLSVNRLVDFIKKKKKTGKAEYVDEFSMGRCRKIKIDRLHVIVALVDTGHLLKMLYCRGVSV